MRPMRKNSNIIEEVTTIMINIMSDDIPIYEFNMLKQSILANMDKGAKRKRASKKRAIHS